MKFLAIILAAILITGCTEDLVTDYRGKGSNRLVVDGVITTDTTEHKVILTRTVDFRATGTVYETGAEVHISDGFQVFYLNEASPGIYITDSTVYGVTGRTYELNIKTMDGEVYTASSTLNPVAEMDSFTFVKEYFEIFDQYFYKVYFFGQEPPEPGQFYMWNLYFNDSLVNDTIHKTTFVSDEMVNGNYISDFDIYWIPEKDVIQDTMAVTLEMISIPEEYNTFLIKVMSETTWRGSPWDSMPANVSTNISNNGVGFFVAQARTKKTIFFVREIEENK